jgi:hypothetical protein
MIRWCDNQSSDQPQKRQSNGCSHFWSRFNIDVFCIWFLIFFDLNDSCQYSHDHHLYRLLRLRSTVISMTFHQKISRYCLTLRDKGHITTPTPPVRMTWVIECFSIFCSLLLFVVRCSMFDVRCSMFDVRCSMFDVRCSILMSMFDVR